MLRRNESIQNCIPAILMDDYNAGLEKRNSDALARQNVWMPVEKAEASTRLRANLNISLVY